MRLKSFSRQKAFSTQCLYKRMACTVLRKVAPMHRRGDYPVQAFDFLGYEFRPRTAVWRDGRPGVSFQPAPSPKALKAIRQTFRRWELHRRSDKDLADLARMFNPYIQGWITTTATSMGRPCAAPCSG
jgi:hypothetical protein